MITPRRTGFCLGVLAQVIVVLVGFLHTRSPTLNVRLRLVFGMGTMRWIVGGLTSTRLMQAYGALVLEPPALLEGNLGFWVEAADRTTWPEQCPAFPGSVIVGMIIRLRPLVSVLRFVRGLELQLVPFSTNPHPVFMAHLVLFVVLCFDHRPLGDLSCCSCVEGVDLLLKII